MNNNTSACTRFKCTFFLNKFVHYDKIDAFSYKPIDSGFMKAMLKANGCNAQHCININLKKISDEL